MTQLNASPNPVFVDLEAGETERKTRVSWSKDPDQELWERVNGGTWEPINPYKKTEGEEKDAETEGFFAQALRPGDVYEIAVFASDHGPLPSVDPILVKALKVFGLLKKPETRRLITDGNSSWGGTWYFRQMATNVPTNIVMIGVSRDAPEADDNGFPIFKRAEGSPTRPFMNTTNHSVEIVPLLPGNGYYFAAVVADAFGNWEMLEDQFRTHRRKLTIEFPTIHVYNDGDYATEGQVEFWFRVYTGSDFRTKDIQEFHLPEQDIDDWNETSRPYSVGFVHLGSLEVVQPETAQIGVSSWAVEEDEPWGEDRAGFVIGEWLPLPSGRSYENVNKQMFRLDCQPSTVGSYLHYGVDVRWSIEYQE